MRLAPSATPDRGGTEINLRSAKGVMLCPRVFKAGFIVGRKHADNCLVHVPPEVVIAIHGGHCVRIDRARATIDKQSWEATPAHGGRM